MSSGRAVSPQASSPRRPRLHEPDGPSPLERVLTAFVPSRPHRVSTPGLVRVAPLSPSVNASGRNVGIALEAFRIEGLDRRAPVELEERVSARIQLYGRSAQRVVSPAPLARLVAGFTGCAAPSKSVEHTLCVQ
jgi:hypothetical protein